MRAAASDVAKLRYATDDVLARDDPGLALPRPLATRATRWGAPKAGGIRAARLHAIKADIVERLGDRDLSVAAVAARQRVSPRYVQALLASEGTTFSAFVLNKRLAHAHSLLADPQGTHRPINAIAFQAGFSDRSHFNRAFRRRYGVVPSDVRAMALRRAG